MFHFSHSNTLTADFSGWPVFLASEDEQDLDLDDAFEDDDFEEDGKPPNKRPYLLILAIALVGGLLYFTLDLNLISSIGNMIVSPTKTTQQDPTPPVKLPTRNTQGTSTHISAPTPHFTEGQIVVVASTPGSTTSIIRLIKNPGGLQSGPSVQVGESLTIVDGAYINNQWVYQVTTQSGSSGWITRQHLKARSS
ncbi:MAG: hypothetical protein GKS05_07370 [Nitrospirales bacterium]|nr:hypothetical protein [Nitrospirales bacterium]